MGQPICIISDPMLRDFDEPKDTEAEDDLNFGQIMMFATYEAIIVDIYDMLMTDFTTKLQCYYAIRPRNYAENNMPMTSNDGKPAVWITWDSTQLGVDLCIQLRKEVDDYNDYEEREIANLYMERTRKSSAADPQSEFKVGAGDLEGLVFISGPCSALPSRCSRRRIPSGVVYRPEVEARDGSERLYSKHNLALFEVLDKDSPSETQGVEEHDEGPAAAVLKRRRRQQQHRLSKDGSEKHVTKAVPKHDADAKVEDTSDEHYRKLHRKPEYMERRVRNREIELYQYAQWQEGQRIGSDRLRQLGGSHQHLASHQQPKHDGGSEAGGSDAAGATQPQSRCASPLILSVKPSNGGNRVAADTGAKGEEADLGDGTTLINETLRRLDAMQTSESASARKRFKSGMRNELRALLDSSGYQDARARSAANNNDDSCSGNGNGGNDVSRVAAKELTPLPLAASAPNTVSDAPAIGADVVVAAAEEPAVLQQQQPLSESERRAAHLGGTILEQLLIQAARLPPLAEDGASDDGEDVDEASESESEDEGEVSDKAEEESEASGEGESQSDSSGSDDGQEDDAGSNSGSLGDEAEDVGDSCCCPREFELPQRLFGHMTRQREQQR
ncbi:hypothetical protein GGI00_000765 [Coemansia sp. RSA 2681]|nr:hypothetical protein GGI00_000765 [Coemansia sp. RSA 2681]